MSSQHPETTITRADWYGRRLERERHADTLFSELDLSEADLTGAKCRSGSIRNADLSGALLHNADFTGCDLRGSDLSAIELKTIHLKDAVITIDQTIFIAEALGLDVRLK
ncbi:MAG TPA: pentapeptide repeat-containing protein [Shinella sp.]|uniref:pentapeptide repeat-containing protein n=1 Tax=Shinella sp. TaxID=1870904 RepID=UPI002E164A63|nr:pentapeptide repeat-containing protein [Shinella sp.]